MSEFTCTYCNRVFTGLANMQQHRDNSCQLNPERSNKGKSNRSDDEKCKVCGKMLNDVEKDYPPGHFHLYCISGKRSFCCMSKIPEIPNPNINLNWLME